MGMRGEQFVKKVLIVDDSAFMRKILIDLFNETSDFTVVDFAKNGFEAVEKVKKYKPDLVTLDIEMPIMNGIDALKIIMRDNPLPVVVVSALTKEGSEETIKALSLGAVDFVTKDIRDLNIIKQSVLTTCRNALSANLKELRETNQVQKPININVGGQIKTKEKFVAIGTSTGGPKALQEVIPKLPANLPCGVVIVQHMPPGFTKSLADRLDSISQIKVKEAENNDIIQKGTVYITPGDFHIKFSKTLDGSVKINLNKEPPIGGHRPAVNPMFESAAELYDSKCIGVLLTGMGQDGATGMVKIKEKKGYNIAESQETSIVYGMPKAAAALGVVDKVVPIYNVADEIIKAVLE